MEALLREIGASHGIKEVHICRPLMDEHIIRIRLRQGISDRADFVTRLRSRLEKVEGVHLAPLGETLSIFLRYRDDNYHIAPPIVNLERDGWEVNVSVRHLKDLDEDGRQRLEEKLRKLLVNP